MTISLLSQGLYNFKIGSNDYTIKADNILDARNNFLNDLERHIDSSIITILDKEQLN